MATQAGTPRRSAWFTDGRRGALATQAGTLKGVEIIASKLGDNAGITGAAVLARRAAK